MLASHRGGRYIPATAADNRAIKGVGQSSPLGASLMQVVVGGGRTKAPKEDLGSFNGNV